MALSYSGRQRNVQGCVCCGGWRLCRLLELSLLCVLTAKCKVWVWPTVAAAVLCAWLQVGLHKEFYDISSWPQELQQQIIRPAVAAAAKGKGMQVPTTLHTPQAAAAPQPQHQQQSGHMIGQQPQSAGDGIMQQLMCVSAVPDSGPQLEVLRQRLWAMLQSEADACNL